MNGNSVIDLDALRRQYPDCTFHVFQRPEDAKLTAMLKSAHFLPETGCEELNVRFERTMVREPDDTFGFLHESAVIEFKGVLYTSWYSCPKHELSGYTPICGKRSLDGGKTWSDMEIIAEDKSEKILYCPPVYGVCDGKLYMLINEMVAPDHMHALDLYVLNEETGKFDFLWSRPIPFKLNTNVVTLPNGKLLLPGRVTELDCFPNTPAVMISDSGKIDAEWRIVRIAENGDLPDGSQLVHPEISVICCDDTLYMFNRNDQRRVPLVYVSKDFGETWSDVMAHDIPYAATKIYTGTLSDGRNYLIANYADADRFDRSRLVLWLTEPGSMTFTKMLLLLDAPNSGIPGATACHYPAAHEENGKLYIIATLSYEWSCRGAILFTVDLKDI
ncbi:MAG: exo-alpha-sialidase [Ruminococcaceae bacterium]|nr:exo-alpha-sialidase [Oscillospiraceae bacterium]